MNLFLTKKIDAPLDVEYFYNNRILNSSRSGSYSGTILYQIKQNEQRPLNFSTFVKIYDVGADVVSFVIAGEDWSLDLCLLGGVVSFHHDDGDVGFRSIEGDHFGRVEQLSGHGDEGDSRSIVGTIVGLELFDKLKE